MKSMAYVITFLLCVSFTLVLPEACDPGLFGRECGFPCPKNCLEKVCDITDGTCGNCSHGWKGIYCDVPCPAGKYGINCASDCGGHCLDGCNNVTGKCDKGCEAGWYTSTCTVMCPQRLYGLNCSLECGQCRDGISCHHVTGRCVSGCEPGFFGEDCKDECPYGTYGYNCGKSCGKDTTCNRVTGECCGHTRDCTEQTNQVNEYAEELSGKEKVIIALAVLFTISILTNSYLFCCACYFCMRNARVKR